MIVGIETLEILMTIFKFVLKTTKKLLADYFEKFKVIKQLKQSSNTTFFPKQYQMDSSIQLR